MTKKYTYQELEIRAESNAACCRKINKLLRVGQRVLSISTLCAARKGGYWYSIYIETAPTLK